MRIRLIAQEDIRNFPCVDDISVHFEKPDGTKYDARPIEVVTTNEQPIDTETLAPLLQHNFHGEYELYVERKPANVRLIAKTSYGYKAHLDFTIPTGKMAYRNETKIQVLPAALKHVPF